MSTQLSPVSLRRLPGVRFDAPTPALSEVLPRMDIACFVGFAANGPVDVPVVVESLAAFEAVFGAELTLLNDAQGQPVRALLHPSVRQFFSQGGRRAWVIRVMGPGSVSAQFPVPRMLQLQRSKAGKAWQVAPAFLRARSPGDWADALRLHAETVATPLSVTPQRLTGDDLTLHAHGPSALGLVVGDVLRLTVADGEWVFGRVSQLGATRNDGQGRLQRELHLHRMASLRRWTGTQQPGRMHWQEPGLRAQQLVQRHADVSEAVWLPDGRLHWQAALPRLTQLEAGEVVRVSFQSGQASAWTVIDTVQTTQARSDGTVLTQFVARPWRLPSSMARRPLRHWVALGKVTGTSSTVQWLRSQLRVQYPDGSASRLEALALSERDDGQAALPTLPDDLSFFAPDAANAARQPTAAAFVAAPRFPLASQGMHAEAAAQAWLCLPLDALPATGEASSAHSIDTTDRGTGARGTALPAC